MTVISTNSEQLAELGVVPDELYDGPDPAAPDFSGQSVLSGAAPNSPPPPARSSGAAYVGVLEAALAVISARLLGLVATVGATVMFGFAAYDPLPWRLYTVATFSVVVLWPIVMLYLKRG